MEELRAMQVWTAALNDKANDDDGIEELEDYSAYLDENVFKSDAFVIQCDLIAMLAFEMGNDTDAARTSWTTSTIEDCILHAVQVEYASVKEGISAQIFPLVEEAFINVV